MSSKIFFCLVILTTLLQGGSSAFSRTIDQDSLIQTTKTRIKEAFKLYYEHPEEAMRISKECNAQAHSISNSDLLAESYNLMGVIHATVGDYDKATEYMKLALSYFEMNKNYQGVSRALNNLSGIFLNIDEPQTALDYNQKSIALKQIHFKDSNDLADSYLAKGIILKKLKSYDSAKIALKQAIKYYDNVTSPYAIQPVAMLAEIFSIEGETVRGLNLLLHEVERYTGDKADPRFKYSDFVLAKLYHRLDSTKKSKVHFNNYISMLRTIDDKTTLANALKEKAYFLKDIGDSDSAYLYLNEHVQVQQELHFDKLKKKIALLEYLYEDEKKEQLILLNEEKIGHQALLLKIAVPTLVFTLILSVAWFYSYIRKKRTLKSLRISHEELMKANKIISEMKDSLEDQVNHRTKEIQEQHLKLLNYAYLNSHKLRAPLARLMGLAYLMKHEKNSVELEKLLNYLQQAAEETDAVVKEINTEVAKEN